MIKHSLMTQQMLAAPPAGAVSAAAIGQCEQGYTVFLGTKVGLLRSTVGDDGACAEWQRLSAAPIGVMSLAASPNYARDRTVIAGAESGIYLSRDGGNTWQLAKQPALRSMILSIGFSPNYAEDGILLAGTLEDGIWFSSTRGDTWVARNFGLLDAAVYALAFSPCFAQDETIYAGSDSAIYYSYNQARAWKLLPFPEGIAPVLSLARSSGGMLYAGTEREGLYRSQDQGIHWEKPNLAASSVCALHVSSAGHLIAATEEGLYQSIDGDQTWEPLVQLPDVISMAGAGDVLVAGLADQGAWLSHHQANWQPAALPPVRSITGFALSPEFERDHTAFLFGRQEGLWKTSDAGATWQRKEELPSFDVNALAISPNFAHNQAAVAATDEGVWTSRDGGEGWQLSAVETAHRLAFSPDGRLLYAAFDQAGLQQSDDMGTTWRHVPGPWDAGGKVLALASGDQEHLYVATLEGVNDVLNIWHGQAGQFDCILQEPAGPNPSVSFWIPDDAGEGCYAGVGDTVWKFGAGPSRSRLDSNSAEAGDMRTLTGARHDEGFTLYACTSRRLYTSSDGVAWGLVHDFGEDTLLTAALSPHQPSQHIIYALLLGGTLWRGAIRLSRAGHRQGEETAQTTGRRGTPGALRPAV
jgi:photosystem II stability/assembly factor-like uncharacterized protein